MRRILRILSPAIMFLLLSTWAVGVPNPKFPWPDEGGSTPAAGEGGQEVIRFRIRDTTGPANDETVGTGAQFTFATPSLSGADLWAVSFGTNLTIVSWACSWNQMTNADAGDQFDLRVCTSSDADVTADQCTNSMTVDADGLTPLAHQTTACSSNCTDTGPGIYWLQVQNVTDTGVALSIRGVCSVYYHST
jgi:hypothetical protein